MGDKESGRGGVREMGSQGSERSRLPVSQSPQTPGDSFLHSGLARRGIPLKAVGSFRNQIEVEPTSDVESIPLCHSASTCY